VITAGVAHQSPYARHGRASAAEGRTGDNGYRHAGQEKYTQSYQPERVAESRCADQDGSGAGSVAEEASICHTDTPGLAAGQS